MGGEIGDILSRIAPAAKEWTEKIFSSEVSRVGLVSGEKSVRAMGPWGDVLVDSVKSWQDKSSQSAGQYYSDMLKLMKGKATGRYGQGTSLVIGQGTATLLTLN